MKKPLPLPFEVVTMTIEEKARWVSCSVVSCDGTIPIAPPPVDADNYLTRLSRT
jgi:hypothetical protein